MSGRARPWPKGGMLTQMEIGLGSGWSDHAGCGPPVLERSVGARPRAQPREDSDWHPPRWHPQTLHVVPCRTQHSAYEVLRRCWHWQKHWQSVWVEYHMLWLDVSRSARAERQGHQVMLY